MADHCRGCLVLVLVQPLRLAISAALCFWFKSMLFFCWAAGACGTPVWHPKGWLQLRLVSHWNFCWKLWMFQPNIPHHWFHLCGCAHFDEYFELVIFIWKFKITWKFPLKDIILTQKHLYPLLHNSLLISFLSGWICASFKSCRNKWHGSATSTSRSHVISSSCIFTCLLYSKNAHNNSCVWHTMGECFLVFPGFLHGFFHENCLWCVLISRFWWTG